MRRAREEAVKAPTRDRDAHLPFEVGIKPGGGRGGGLVQQLVCPPDGVEQSGHATAPRLPVLRGHELRQRRTSSRCVAIYV